MPNHQNVQGYPNVATDLMISVSSESEQSFSDFI